MAETSSRIDWVDYSKGICIILVVFMHSTLGVENALGLQIWLHGFIEWARPFRMPDFFMLSGLFLASRIDRPWRAYLDTKLFHFAYFYALWVTTFGLQRVAFAVSLALVLLMIPVVVRSTEEMLRLVPRDLLEASYALGVPRWKTVKRATSKMAFATPVTTMAPRAMAGKGRRAMTAMGAPQ